MSAAQFGGTNETGFNTNGTGGENETTLQRGGDASRISYLPLDEFPPFLLSCSASKTNRATVRGVTLKSTFSQEHINILGRVNKSSAGCS